MLRKCGGCGEEFCEDASHCPICITPSGSDGHAHQPGERNGWRTIKLFSFLIFFAGAYFASVRFLEGRVENLFVEVSLLPIAIGILGLIVAHIMSRKARVRHS